MQLGVSSYAFGWAVGVAGHPPAQPFTEDDLVAFAQAQQLRLIQFGDHIPLHSFDAPRLARLAAKARAAGIAIETGARGLTPAHLTRNIELSRQLDARLLRFVIDGPGFEPATETVVATIRDALPLLERANVTLGIENHDRFPARTLRRLIDDVGSPRVGICLDTANSIGAGEGLATVLEHLGPVTVNLHIKDFTIARVPYAMGFTVTGRPAGKGMLDVPKLRDEIAAHGRCRTAVLETWTTPEPELQATIAKERAWAESSLAYLRPLFALPT
jgi:sugar phosphate isomerase/epimerase